MNESSSPADPRRESLPVALRAGWDLLPHPLCAQHLQIRQTHLHAFRYGYGYKLGEGLLRFLALVNLADALDREVPKKKADKWFKMLVNPGMGKYLGLLRSTSKFLTSQGRRPFLAELGEILPKGRWEEQANVLVAERDPWAHERVQVSEDEAPRLIRRLEPALHHLVLGLGFLQRYRLGRALGLESRGSSFTFQWYGSRGRDEVCEPVQLECQRPPVTGGTMLLDPVTGRTLWLDPFFRWLTTADGATRLLWLGGFIFRDPKQQGYPLTHEMSGRYLHPTLNLAETLDFPLMEAHEAGEVTSCEYFRRRRPGERVTDLGLTEDSAARLADPPELISSGLVLPPLAPGFHEDLRARTASELARLEPEVRQAWTAAGGDPKDIPEGEAEAEAEAIWQEVLEPATGHYLRILPLLERSGASDDLRRELDQAIAGTDELPPSGSAEGRLRLHVVFASEDRLKVERWVRDWRAAGDEVFYDRDRRASQGPWRGVTEKWIALSDEVHLFWSEAAEQDLWIEEQLYLAAVHGRPVSVHRLDRRPAPPIPDECRPKEKRGLDAVPWLTWGGLAGAGALVVVSAHLGGGWGLPLLYILLLLGGLWLARLQYTGTSGRHALAGRLRRRAGWLARAKVDDIIGAGEAALNWLYGPKTVSKRTFLLSALFSTLVIVPTAIPWILTARPLGWLYTVIFGLVSLIISSPLLLVNVITDFLCLVLIRHVIQRALQARSKKTKWVGIMGDLALTLACIAAPIVINGTSLFDLIVNGEWSWRYPEGAFNHLGLLLTDLLPGFDVLRLDRAFYSVNGMAMLINGVAALTTSSPATLVHVTLIFLALLSGLTGHRLLRGTGSVLSVAARDRHDPRGVAYCAVVALAALALAVPCASRQGDVEALSPADEPGWSREIPAGSYRIGTPRDEEGRGGDERLHQVELPADYQLTATEITQGWWRTVWNRDPETAEAWGLPEYPSMYVGDELPVSNVSWCDAARFCNLWSLTEARIPVYCVGQGCCDLSRDHTSRALAGCERGEDIEWCEEVEGSPPMKDTRWGYRLPTEAEWEVAARAGTTTRWWFGDDEAELDTVAWYADNSGIMPHEVGQKRLNPWGLYDVHGNVWEWCWDWYGSYMTDRVTEPTSPVGRDRVLRGGAFGSEPRNLRSGNRSRGWPWNRSGNNGFRAARSLRREP